MFTKNGGMYLQVFTDKFIKIADCVAIFTNRKQNNNL